MTETKKEMRLPETKDLAYYLSLNYPMEIVEDDGRFVVSVPDLPGCTSYGDTAEEALSNLKATKDLWLKGALESRSTIPEPVTPEDFSGKFVLRIPRSLHQALDRESGKQGVSLNMYIAHLLAERHRLISLETLVGQLASACVAPPKVTTLDYKRSDVGYWKSENLSDYLKEWHFSRTCSHRLYLDDAPLEDIVSSIPKPPKVYRRVVKHSKLGDYQNV